jgi:hypothetical protein
MIILLSRNFNNSSYTIFPFHDHHIKVIAFLGAMAVVGGLRTHSRGWPRELEKKKKEKRLNILKILQEYKNEDSKFIIFGCKKQTAAGTTTRNISRKYFENVSNVIIVKSFTLCGFYCKVVSLFFFG